MTKESKPRKRLVPVRVGKEGQNVAKVSNNLVLPLAATEAIVAGIVCYLNYLLRYDSKSREDCSMVNWEGVKLPCLSGDSSVRQIYNATDGTTYTVTFTLPEWTFFTCAIVVPLGLVILVETVKSLFPPTNVKVVTTGKLALNPVHRRIPRYICSFMMGGAVVGTLVSVLKLLIPSPRPHFMEMCAPNGTLTDFCSAGSFWFPDAACEGTVEDVHEALRAFPSYHASLATYCGIWTVVYLSTACLIPGLYNPTMVLVAAVLVMTSIGSTHHLFIGMSSTNDVFAGMLIGGVAALYVSLVILNGFKERDFHIQVMRENPSTDVAHKNMLPIIPLNGTEQRTRPHSTPNSTMKASRDVRFEDDLPDVGNISFVSEGLDDFAYATTIPRAQTIYVSKQNTGHSPAQAVNSNVGQKSRIPKPPPLPSYGPPPTYTSTEIPSSYNIPRQRYSAPTRSPQVPSYDDSQGNIINAYHSRDSDAVPRARTETSSYF